MGSFPSEQLNSKLLHTQARDPTQPGPETSHLHKAKLLVRALSSISPSFRPATTPFQTQPSSLIKRAGLISESLLSNQLGRTPCFSQPAFPSLGAYRSAPSALKPAFREKRARRLHSTSREVKRKRRRQVWPRRPKALASRYEQISSSSSSGNVHSGDRISVCGGLLGLPMEGRPLPAGPGSDKINSGNAAAAACRARVGRRSSGRLFLPACRSRHMTASCPPKTGLRNALNA